MSFLIKIAAHRETSSNIPDNSDNKSVHNGQQEKQQKINGSSSKQKPTKVKQTNELDKKMMAVIDASLEKGQSRIMSFFKGIAPSIEKFNEADIIDFQYEVMKLIKTISTKYETPQHFPRHSGVPCNQASHGHHHFSGALSSLSSQTACRTQEQGHMYASL